MKKINKKKVFFVSIIFLISICLIFYFIFTYFSNPIQPRIVHKKHKNTSYPTVSFVAVGDNIIHKMFINTLINKETMKRIILNHVIKI